MICKRIRIELYKFVNIYSLWINNFYFLSIIVEKSLKNNMKKKFIKKFEINNLNIEIKYRKKNS